MTTTDNQDLLAEVDREANRGAYKPITEQDWAAFRFRVEGMLRDRIRSLYAQKRMLHAQLEKLQEQHEAVLAIATYYEQNLMLHTQLEKLQDQHEAVLVIAAYFQDDYSLKLPVIAAFRLWRSGGLSTEEFLQRLRADDLAPVLRMEPVPPMAGLTILNDHREKKP